MPASIDRDQSNTSSTIPAMSTDDWPRERFNADLDRWMRRAGLPERGGRPSRADLARLAGLDVSTPATWRTRAQPTRESLRAIAPILGVPLDELEVSAGLLVDGDREAGAEPLDLPPPLADLVAAWRSSTPALADALIADVARVLEVHEMRRRLDPQK